MPTLPGSVYAGYGQCEISPSDLASAVDNLWNQVIALKQEVELLKSSNTIVGAIDEISQDLGTMTNATLINAARGWITEGTFSGVAISTLGWTLPGCDGNPVAFPVVSVNADGSLNFGFDTNGNVCGAQADIWNAAAAGAGTPDYYLIAPTYHTSGSRGITKTADSSATLSRSVTFEVASDGLYHVNVSAEFDLNVGGGDTGTLLGEITVGTNALPFSDYVNGVSSNAIIDFTNMADTNMDDNGIRGIAYSNLYSLSAGDTLNIAIAGSVQSGTLANAGLGTYRISVMKVGTA